MKHILPLFFLSAAVIAAPQIAPTTFPTCDVPIVDRVFNPPPPDQDASPALQAVIDELAKAGGGTIFIPAGHVRIATPIILKEGVKHLLLAGVLDFTGKGNGFSWVGEVVLRAAERKKRTV